MATKTTTKKTAVKKTVKPVEATTVVVSMTDRSRVLIRPRITEKSTLLGTRNVFVFEVADRATKRDIIMAVRDIYKIIPTAVRIVRTGDEKVRSRKTGLLGTKRTNKKAYITVKQGESITI